MDSPFHQNRQRRGEQKHLVIAQVVSLNSVTNQAADNAVTFTVALLIILAVKVRSV
jgi:hypothetical protein